MFDFDAAWEHKRVELLDDDMVNVRIFLRADACRCLLHFDIHVSAVLVRDDPIAARALFTMGLESFEAPAAPCPHGTVVLLEDTTVVPLPNW